MDPRIPCRDCSMWPCLCGNRHVWPTDVRSAKAAPRVPRPLRHSALPFVTLGALIMPALILAGVALYLVLR